MVRIYYSTSSKSVWPTVFCYSRSLSTMTAFMSSFLSILSLMIMLNTSGKSRMRLLAKSHISRSNRQMIVGLRTLEWEWFRFWQMLRIMCLPNSPILSGNILHYLLTHIALVFLLSGLVSLITELRLLVKILKLCCNTDLYLSEANMSKALIVCTLSSSVDSLKGVVITLSERLFTTWSISFSWNHWLAMKVKSEA